jgi:hypothetical protein
MKAMLDPRIVAANTHGAVFGVQAERTPFERIMPSSQGCLITLAIDAPDRITGASGLSSLRDVARRVGFSPTVLPWRSRYIPQMAYFVTLQARQVLVGYPIGATVG